LCPRFQNTTNTNTKSDRGMQQNILAIRDNVTFEERIKAPELFQKQTLTIIPNTPVRQ
jgi:hypothetical protein